ncbi:hypothetical protein WA538_004795 [Blastocystis sp. DL]
MSPPDINPAEVCNINVGVMGHVDSGKTSLVKSLSAILSTASLDKNPQSRARGITLDLGFSAFLSDIPSQLKDSKYKHIQYTLVDCPGHASLIRTILGGAQIIDMLLIVIDCLKGIQTQTAECMVIGEITTDKAIFVLNKIDLLPEKDRSSRIQSIETGLRKTLSKTRFKNAPIIAVAAQVGGGSIEDVNTTSIGMDQLVSTICGMVSIPNKIDNQPLYFVYDHCFSLAGKGCVMTGTIQSGRIAVNDEIEFPSLHIMRKVKSIQMFHKNIDCAMGFSLIINRSFDYKTERGEACSVGSLSSMQTILIRLRKVRFFKGDIASGSTFHISIGHHTIPATITLFADESKEEVVFADRFGVNVFSEEVDSFDFSKSYQYVPTYHILKNDSTLWALLQLETPIFAPRGCLLIGSHLNVASSDTSCRIAFYGKVIQVLSPEKEALTALRVYKPKMRSAVVDRVVSELEVIGTNLLEKGGSVQPFVGLKVVTKDGVEGVIDAPFGKTGKFKVVFRSDHRLSKNDELFVHFRRYLYDKDKKIQQD